jgi:hypothetical protein
MPIALDSLRGAAHEGRLFHIMKVLDGQFEDMKNVG